MQFLMETKYFLTLNIKASTHFKDYSCDDNLKNNRWGVATPIIDFIQEVASQFI